MSARSSKITWIVGVVLALLICVPLTAKLLRREEPTAPATLGGQLWGAQLGGSPRVLYVTHTMVRKPVSRGFDEEPSYEHYSRFELALRRIPEGTLVATLPLGETKYNGDRRQSPQIIGVVGDVVWIWRDSLEARSLNDLSFRASIATLTRGAVESTAELPKEPSGYAVAPDSAALIARGRDARFYRIDLARSVIEPVDPASFPPTTFSARTEDRFDYLVPPGRSRRVTDLSRVMQKSFLTSTGLWYALLSESERSGLSRWPSGESTPFGDVARTLYRVPYKLDDRNQPEIDPARLTPVGNERMIQAGFVVRRTRAVWDVADPSSSLVLTKRLLGAEEPWDVVRLARDGTVVWRTSTELSSASELLDLGSHIAFVGMEPGGPPDGGGQRSERVVWIDQRTGARGSLAIATGEAATSALTARVSP